MADSDDEWEAPASVKDSESERSTRSGSMQQCSDSDVVSVASDDSSTDVKTTLRLVDLPHDFSRSDLEAMLLEEGLDGFDFVYLPADFKRPGKCFGYAFVNWSTQEAAVQALEKLEDRYGAAWAAAQGLASHIDRFRNSPVMHEKVADEAKPALYQNGCRVAFPPPTKRIVAPRVKTT